MLRNLYAVKAVSKANPTDELPILFMTKGVYDAIRFNPYYFIYGQHFNIYGLPATFEFGGKTHIVKLLKVEDAERIFGVKINK